MEELLRQLKEQYSKIQSENDKYSEWAKWYAKELKNLKVNREPCSIKWIHTGIDDVDMWYAKLLYIRECKKKIDKKITKNNRTLKELNRQINALIQGVKND